MINNVSAKVCFTGIAHQNNPLSLASKICEPYVDMVGGIRVKVCNRFKNAPCFDLNPLPKKNIAIVSSILSTIRIYLYLFYSLLCRTFLPQGLVGALLDSTGLKPVTADLNFLSSSILNQPPVSIGYVPSMNALVAIFKVKFQLAPLFSF